MPGHPGRSVARGRLHIARQSGRRGHQRHRRTRAGQHRAARQQAGNGRQGLPVQEVRRHRRFRYRAGRERPRQAGRHHRGTRADAGRHQPRGHQGARVLLHRAQAAGAHEHPGVPRRPAWHRHHLRCSAHQRARTGGQEDRRREDRGVGRGCGRHRLPRRDGRAGRQAQQHLRGRFEGPDLHGTRWWLRRLEVTLCAKGHRRPHSGGRHEKCRRVPRLLGARRGHAGHGQKYGQPADHPGAGQP